MTDIKREIGSQIDMEMDINVLSKNDDNLGDVKNNKLETTRIIEKNGLNMNTDVHTNKNSKTNDYCYENVEEEETNRREDNESDMSSEYSYKNKFRLKKNSIEIKRDNLLKEKIKVGNINKVDVTIFHKRENSLSQKTTLDSHFFRTKEKTKKEKNAKIKKIDIGNEKTTNVLNKKTQQDKKKSSTFSFLSDKHANGNTPKQNQGTQKSKIQPNIEKKNKETNIKAFTHKRSITAKNRKKEIDEERQEEEKEEEEEEEEEEKKEQERTEEREEEEEEEREEEEEGEGEEDGEEEEEEEEEGEEEEGEEDENEIKKGKGNKENIDAETNINDTDSPYEHLRKIKIFQKKTNKNELSPLQLFKKHEKLVVTINELHEGNSEEIQNLRNDFLAIKSEIQKLMNFANMSQKFITALK